jgi:hypothetical protein
VLRKTEICLNSVSGPMYYVCGSRQKIKFFQVLKREEEREKREILIFTVAARGCYLGLSDRRRKPQRESAKCIQVEFLDPALLRVTKSKIKFYPEWLSTSQSFFKNHASGSTWSVFGGLVEHFKFTPLTSPSAPRTRLLPFSSSHRSSVAIFGSSALRISVNLCYNVDSSCFGCARLSRPPATRPLSCPSTSLDSQPNQTQRSLQRAHKNIFATSCARSREGLQEAGIVAGGALQEGDERVKAERIGHRSVRARVTSSSSHYQCETLFALMDDD